MILVAVGANLPGPDGADPLTTCRRAAMALDAVPGLRLRGLSRWWQTSPEPPSGQPDFVNGVALLTGVVDPEWLLRELQAIEARFGRRRGLPNAARTLDLDIVAIGRMVRDRPDPILPHPRAHLRGFVLLPLQDVQPGWVHPKLNRSVADLLSCLPAQTARPI